MAIGKAFDDLLSALGYVFVNEELLQTALTHSSYANEYKNKGLNYPSNERFEFLGDAVLEIVISDILFSRYTDYSEGRLTKIRQNLVCERTLYRIASSLKLGDYIHLGRGEENECRNRPKVLADALEAIIGAVYLDLGKVISDILRQVILNLFEDELSTVGAINETDYKTMLQQFIEKDGQSLLEYETSDESGPEHNKTFTVVCKINGNIVGNGTASNKKDAQMLAAKEALLLFGLL